MDELNEKHLSVLDMYRQAKFEVEREAQRHNDIAFQHEMMAQNHREMAAHLIDELNENTPVEQDE